MIRRIAITGSSGYYGRKLIDRIRTQAPEARILGCDVAPARDSAPDEFVPLDVRDPNLVTTLQAFAPDTIVHLAFVVNPTHDDRQMRSINIDGSRNVFAAVRTLRPNRFLMASSATVYGSFPDNPVPADESWQIRARPNYRYAVDKTEIERLIAELGRDLPEVAVSWTRPAIIYGPQVHNYLSKFLIHLPLVVLMDGFDCPLQFVHEDDVAAATWRILEAGGRGPYNIGPPDWVHLSQIAKYSGRPIITLPFWMIRCITTCWWGLRLPVFEFPVGMLYFLR
ncbi:MAG TPA: NAD-dependent epimerase/dehydratase family protein, partial [Planctomycetaceae bacterium]|nr:NAD-dependent epimerase/dehydratase family protein [Planctomycetaceae bacterium]